jgi:hypothetical protein
MRKELGKGRELASWPNGGASRGLCLGAYVEGHQGLSLSPRSEDRSIAMPPECRQAFNDHTFSHTSTIYCCHLLRVSHSPIA